MYLYRLDNADGGNVTTARIAGKITTIYEREFETSELLAASQSGWMSLEALRAKKLARAIKPKGRAGLV